MTKKTINQRGPGKSSAFRNRDGRFEKVIPREGRTVTRESVPAKGGSFAYAERVILPSTARPTPEPKNLKLVRPVEKRIDPRELAAEILVSHKIIMDHLAK
ncbi:hypothetical protein U8P73_36315 (plasmid) [Rhizobium beringeri]|uniref:hypothetical protein n=1 Tax=Rhizobium beringeri TaxID=3019934 RepID=UPI002DDD5152|nr:hypothetical protein [Rhizobium beringeri]WSG93615.1 hypothetical protein U8P73_36315 [Rhizobium beringeri]